MLERNILDDNLTLSAYVLRRRLEGREPTVGLVLGSGLTRCREPFETRAIMPSHSRRPRHAARR